MFCEGRDRSLQCNRSSLKSSTTSVIQFCREHAPSGSTEIEVPARHEDSNQLVAELPQSQSFTGQTDRKSQDVDDATDSKIHLLVLSQSPARNSGETRTMLASLYVPRSSLTGCKTPGCDRAAGKRGYCAGCQNKPSTGSDLAAIECPNEDTEAADDVDEVRGAAVHCEKGNSEELVDEVEAHSLLHSSEVVDSAQSQQRADCSSRSQTTAGDGTTYVDISLCRGPYCNNAGLQRLRGLCVACYRTLLYVNLSLHNDESPDDIGAGLDYSWLPYH